MNFKWKKALSMLLAIVLLLSLLQVSSLAVETSDFEWAGDTVVSDGTTAKTATVKLKVNKDCWIYTLYGVLPTSLAEGKITLTSLSWPITNAGSLDYIDKNAGVFKYSNAGEGTEFGNGDVVVTAQYTVAADTPASTYSVDLTQFEAEDDDGSFVRQSKSATITVKEPSAATADYELYYELTGGMDPQVDGDEYVDYAAGADVVATIYMKAKDATMLQAFDLYVENDANLTYKSCESTYGTRIAYGNGSSTATRQHIQAVGASKDNPIDVALPANTPVEIAKITFTVNANAVYNTPMPITISNDSNVAIENEVYSINPGSAVHPLTIGGTVAGAEVMTTYTVQYDGNGGADVVTNIPTNQTKQYNVPLTLSSVEPSRTGYNFTGWNTAANGSGVSYDKGASYTANAPATLYAQWEKKNYTVTWKSQDGTTMLGTSSIAYNSLPAYPTDFTEPTKAATDQYTYTFAGWNTSPNQETGTALGSLGPVTGDITYYAAFSKTTNQYTVTWYNHDGSATLKTDSNVPYGTQPNYSGEDPTRAPDAQYTYSFNGWATNPNQETGVAVGSLPTVKGNVAYYAAFSKTVNSYDVTFDSDGHGTAPAKQTIAYGAKVSKPSNPSDTGYTFVSWQYFDSADSTWKDWDFENDTVTGTLTLKAKWTENTYTVHYDKNASDATGTVPADETLSYTQSYTIASGSTLSRPGYTFAGWNTQPDGNGTPYSANATVSKLSATQGDTVNLYAQWTTADYTIAYNYDNATTTPSNPTAYNVEDLPITLQRPAKTGYTFDHWEITSDSGSVTLDGDVIKSGTTGNLTVTAIWSAAKVTYKVEHYKQNVDNDDYTLVSADTETKQGFTGDLTAAERKLYIGFSFQQFNQERIAADGSTVVKIYYTRNTYTVSYEFTGTVPAGAPTAPTSVTVKYGAEVTVQPPLSMVGYDFSGWSTTNVTVTAGKFNMPDNDVAFKGSWAAATVAYTVKHMQQNIENDEYTEVIDDRQTLYGKTGEQTNAVATSYEGFTAQTVTQTTIAADGTTVVEVKYDRNTHKVTYSYTNEVNAAVADSVTALPTEATVKYGTQVTIADAATADAYTFGGWKKDSADAVNFTMPDADVSITGTWTPTEYTITFNTDGGAAITAQTYTIESDYKLPEATGKTNYSFDKWQATTVPAEGQGNWAQNSTYDKEAPVAGKWGDVTLTALWNVALNYKVEEYKYAPSGYKLLIIDAAGAGEGKVYQFDGATMYYTTDANYMIGTADTKSTAVFYTLVQVGPTTLTNEDIAKITTVDADRTSDTFKINYTSGDINGDGVTNIADANAVYQMIVNGGNYYPALTQLTIEQRLMADMDTSTSGTDAEYRGSIKDVQAIVYIINGGQPN